MTVDFNIKILHKYRGLRFAEKAMILFCDYFFNQFGGLVLTDKVALKNNRSKEVLLRFGFQLDPSVKGVFMLKLKKDRFNYLYKDSQIKDSI